MFLWLYIDFLILILVISITGFIIPQILLIAFRKNLFDEPDPRKIHQTEVPRLGGIAFFPAILFALLLLFGIGMMYDDGTLMVRLQIRIVPLCFTGCGALILYMTGMADDLVGVRYRAKFVMQTIAAALIITGGVHIDNLHGFCGLYELPESLSILITGLFIVFVINAINLIDGIDGLASGLSAVACCYYTAVFLQSGLYVYSAVSVATLGTLLPFFFFNVFGDPKKQRKIFMGDTGALIIGLMLCVMSIVCIDIEWIDSGANPAVIAIAPLLIPGFDVVRVYIHRLRAGRNPFMPDKSHIHHKLLALGMTQRKAMMLIVVSSVILIGINYMLSAWIDITLLFFGDIALLIALNIMLTRAIRYRERRLDVTLFS